MESYKLRMEARMCGDAAVRIALWEPCKGQVEYVGKMAMEAAHLANKAAQVEASNWNNAGAQRTALVPFILKGLAAQSPSPAIL